MATILIADDDQELSGLLREYLEQENFVVRQAYDGDAALAAGQSLPPEEQITHFAELRRNATLRALVVARASGEQVDFVRYGQRSRSLLRPDLAKAGEERLANLILRTRLNLRHARGAQGVGTNARRWRRSDGRRRRRAGAPRRRRNGQSLGRDPYFDNLFCMAAKKAFMSCEKIVPTEQLTSGGPLQSLLINRMMVSGVVEAPGGAHFTECPPDYSRDEAFQREYAKTAKDEDAWKAFRAKYLDVSEDDYQKAVAS